MPVISFFLIFLHYDWQVMIIRGKDKGETGLVKRVVRSQNRVIVEGKNLVRNLYLIGCDLLSNTLFDSSANAKQAFLLAMCGFLIHENRNG